MKIVVDSNIIFSALIKDSTTRKIIMCGELELLTINASHWEFMRYKSRILRKSQLDEHDLLTVLHELKMRFTFVDDHIVLSKFDEGVEIMKDIDLKDAPFIAAALATNADIWSDDRHFQKQDKVRVWKTKDLVQKVFK